MNNSVFGKAMENLGKIINVRLVNNAKNYVKYVSKPSFVSRKIFSKIFVTIHQIRPVLTTNKQIYVGVSIFGLGKYLIYKVHYKYIKSKSDVNLLFAESKTNDVYEDFYKDRNVFDFSAYLLNSEFLNPANKKLLAKRKMNSKKKQLVNFLN